MRVEQSERLPRAVVLPARSALLRAYDAFMVDREAMRCTVKTLAFYKYALGDFLSFCRTQDLAAPGDLTAGLIRSFFVSLDRRGLKDTSVHVHARAVKTFCRWLLAEGLVSVNPFERVTMPRLDRRILPALTVDQVGQLVAVATDREKAVILCLLDSGCRASEFVGLNVGDVDMRSGAVIIRLGKGRKDRATFLGARPRKALWRYLRSRGDLDDGAALWISLTSGDRLTANGLAEMLMRLGKRAGVTPCRPHLFRRTFALMSLRAGADLHSLARLMGHAGLQVLQRYLDLDQADLQAVHRRTSPVDRLP